MGNSQITDELPNWVQPGVNFRYDYGDDNPHTGRLFHVRGIVDGRAVLREWIKRKNRWEYHVIGGIEFGVMSENIVPEREGE